MNSIDSITLERLASSERESGSALVCDEAGPRRGLGRATRLEQARHGSELSYRRLFESVKEGVVILEADGRVSDVNPFLTEMLGFSRDELLGKPIWELGPLSGVLINKAGFERLRQPGPARREMLTLEKKDGRRITAEFVCYTHQTGGRDVIQCNIRDITENKLAEQDTRAAHAELEERVRERTAQLRAANEELHAFSYSLSHDLRAPLRHVLGFMQLLQDDAGPALSEKSLRYLTTIAESAERMGGLIDNLVALANIGAAEPQRTEVQLEPLVLSVLGDFKEETRDRNMAWEIHPLPTVRADRALLRLVLFQLISNAVKFTSGRAEARIEIGCLPGDPDETVIFIRDNGAGFDPRFAGKLFGVFQRLHGADEFKGSGMGLVNVQRIIQRHGGRTWAEGTVNEGATLYFSIPNQKGDTGGN